MRRASSSRTPAALTENDIAQVFLIRQRNRRGGQEPALSIGGWRSVASVPGVGALVGGKALPWSVDGLRRTVSRPSALRARWVTMLGACLDRRRASSGQSKRRVIST
ncbi:MAG: hypothetical protein QOG43_1845 [Actinomycetota bacterium]|nr:hypothetical protein [Actinomycetota bacterium]